VAGLTGPFTAIHSDVRDDWSLFKALRDHQVEYIIDSVGDTFVPRLHHARAVLRQKCRRHSKSPPSSPQALSIKHMLYVASTEVYGEAPCPKCDEKTELNPVNT
jgi:hypothetical protein